MPTLRAAARPPFPTLPLPPAAAPRRYSLTDQGYGLRGNNVTLVLNWNTVPATGLLTLSHEHRNVHAFQVPDEYSS